MRIPISALITLTALYFSLPLMAQEIDTDCDGMPDSWENGNGLNPRSFDSVSDPDSDGLNNIQEYRLGTDPKNPDTDGDGLNDGFESRSHMITRYWMRNYWGNPRAAQGINMIATNGIIDFAASQYDYCFLLDNGKVIDLSGNEVANDAVQIAGSIYHFMALKKNGTVACWGDNMFHALEVPSDLSNVVAISASKYHSVALKANGDIVRWGYWGGFVQGKTEIVQIAASTYYCMGLRKDGRIEVVYEDGMGVPDIPAEHFIKISGGEWHTLGLRADGVVSMLSSTMAAPADLNDAVDISAMGNCSSVLKKDGSVIGWDDTAAYTLPQKIAGASKVCAGFRYEAALVKTGLDPKNPDTDGDGVYDGWESKNNLNPLADDSSLDLDGDGMSVLDEFLYGGNPNEFDADDESMYSPDRTDTRFYDFDKDGICNIDELDAGTDPKEGAWIEFFSSNVTVLSWFRPEQSTDFMVEYSCSMDESSVDVSTKSMTPNVLLPGLIPGEAYIAVISATDGSGWSKTISWLQPDSICNSFELFPRISPRNVNYASNDVIVETVINVHDIWREWDGFYIENTNAESWVLTGARIEFQKMDLGQPLQSVDVTRNTDGSYLFEDGTQIVVARLISDGTPLLQLSTNLMLDRIKPRCKLSFNIANTNPVTVYVPVNFDFELKCEVECARNGWTGIVSNNYVGGDGPRNLLEEVKPGTNILNGSTIDGIDYRNNNYRINLMSCGGNLITSTNYSKFRIDWDGPKGPLYQVYGLNGEIIVSYFQSGDDDAALIISPPLGGQLKVTAQKESGVKTVFAGEVQQRQSFKYLPEYSCMRAECYITDPLLFATAETSGSYKKGVDISTCPKLTGQPLNGGRFAFVKGQTKIRVDNVVFSTNDLGNVPADAMAVISDYIKGAVTEGEYYIHWKDLPDQQIELDGKTSPCLVASIPSALMSVTISGISDWYLMTNDFPFVLKKDDKEIDSILMNPCDASFKAYITNDIPASDRDFDRDRIIDWADGFNHDRLIGTADDRCLLTNSRIRVDLPSYVPSNQCTLKFIYAENRPDRVTKDEKGNYQPEKDAAGFMRLWNYPRSPIVSLPDYCQSGSVVEASQQLPYVEMMRAGVADLTLALIPIGITNIIASTNMQIVGTGVDIAAAGLVEEVNNNGTPGNEIDLGLYLAVNPEVSKNMTLDLYCQNTNCAMIFGVKYGRNVRLIYTDLNNRPGTGDDSFAKTGCPHIAEAHGVYRSRRDRDTLLRVSHGDAWDEMKATVCEITLDRTNVVLSGILKQFAVNIDYRDSYLSTNSQVTWKCLSLSDPGAHLEVVSTSARRMTMDPSKSDHGSYLVTAKDYLSGTYDACTVTVNRAKVDLDVDSDSNNGFDSTWNPTTGEDAIEDDITMPGRIIGVFKGDSDGDGIPDFADGFNADPDRTEDDLSSQHFVPLKISVVGLSGSMLSGAKIRFVYDGDEKVSVAAKTEQVDWSLKNQKRYELPESSAKLRIWKKDGAVKRDRELDYIKPNEWYAVNDICGDKVAVLYAEALRKSDKLADVTVRAELSLDSDIVATADQIRMTALAPDIQLYSKNNLNLGLEDPENEKWEDIEPFAFWVNDNHDGAGRDCDDSRINGTNDLLDLAPFNVNVPDVVKPGSLPKPFKYRLSIGNAGQGKKECAIQVFYNKGTVTTLRLDNAEYPYAYLRAEDASVNQRKARYVDFNDSTRDAIITEGDPRELRNSDLSNGGTNRFVFEGCDYGKARLCFELYDIRNKCVIASDSALIELPEAPAENSEGNQNESVAGLFGEWNLRGQRSFWESILCLRARSSDELPVRKLEIGTQDEWWIRNPSSENIKDDEIRQRKINQCVFYVHGFNERDSEARVRKHRPVFKRLFWAGIPVHRYQGGHFVAVHWPGDVGRWIKTDGIKYNYDSFNAFYAGKELGEAWRRQQKESGNLQDAKLHVIAHSLGNCVAGQAIQSQAEKGADGARVASYSLLECAITASAFDRGGNSAQVIEENIDYARYSGYGLDDSADRMWRERWAQPATKFVPPNSKDGWQMKDGRKWELIDSEYIPWSDQLWRSRWAIEASDLISIRMGETDMGSISNVYCKRWTQECWGGDDNPWRGVFDKVAESTEMHNFVTETNSGDQVSSVLRWEPKAHMSDEWMAKLFVEKKYPVWRFNQAYGRPEDGGHGDPLIGLLTKRESFIDPDGRDQWDEDMPQEPWDTDEVPEEMTAGWTDKEKRECRRYAELSHYYVEIGFPAAVSPIAGLDDERAFNHKLTNLGQLMNADHSYFVNNQNYWLLYWQVFGKMKAYMKP